MADATSTRRSILGAMALAPVVIAAPASSLTVQHSGIAGLIAMAQAADLRVKQHHINAFEPAYARFQSARAAVPHVTIEVSPNWRINPKFWSTDRPEGMQMARSLVAVEGKSKRSDVVCARKLLAASHRRDRAIRRLAVSTGCDRERERSDELGAIACAADEAVYAYPARTVAEVEAKLAHMIKRGSAEEEGMPETILADLRRVLGRGAT